MPALLNDSKYEQITQDERFEAHGRIERPEKRRSLYPIIFTAVNILVFIGTISVAFFSSRPISLTEHLRATSSYTPIFDVYDPDPEIKLVNATFYTPKDASIARQMPNPEADEIWHELEITRVYPISKEQLIKMGKDPKTAVKLENEVWGEGEDMYASVFDMFHQLHCLNALRYVIYGGYYNQTMGDHTKPRRHHELHINHCMDILYQSITCSNNFNLLSLHWAEGQPTPFPDMSINRQCINFDKFMQWRKDNTIDMDKWTSPGLMLKPEGHAEMPWGDEI